MAVGDVTASAVRGRDCFGCKGRVRRDPRAGGADAGGRDVAAQERRAGPAKARAAADYGT